MIAYLCQLIRKELLLVRGPWELVRLKSNGRQRGDETVVPECLVGPPVAFAGVVEAVAEVACPLAL